MLCVAVIALGGQRENSVFSNQAKVVKVLCSTPTACFETGGHGVLYRAQRTLLLELLKHCMEPCSPPSQFRFIPTHTRPCCVCNRLTSLDRTLELQFLSLKHRQCGTQKLDASMPISFHPRPRPLLRTGQLEQRPRLCGLEWTLIGKCVYFGFFFPLLLIPVKRFTRGSL